MTAISRVDLKSQFLWICPGVSERIFGRRSVFLEILGAVAAAPGRAGGIAVLNAPFCFPAYTRGALPCLAGSRLFPVVAFFCAEEYRRENQDKNQMVGFFHLDPFSEEKPLLFKFKYEPSGKQIEVSPSGNCRAHTNNDRQCLPFDLKPLQNS